MYNIPMKSPLPGIDPYLEHPSLWPDMHNQLMAALADDLSARVAPRYYVGVARRACLLEADDLVLIGRPDIAIASTTDTSGFTPHLVATSVTVQDVDVPMQDEVSETFLEIHEVKTGKLITVLELLSPANKLHRQGREEDERTRGSIFRRWTNLVEIDLIRAGEPRPVVGGQVQSDYRILSHLCLSPIQPGPRRSSRRHSPRE
jgi:uncharacterized protein DUF4058